MPVTDQENLSVCMCSGPRCMCMFMYVYAFCIHAHVYMMYTCVCVFAAISLLIFLASINYINDQNYACIQEFDTITCR